MALLEREEIDDEELTELIGPPVEPADSPLGPPDPSYLDPAALADALRENAERNAEEDPS